VSASAITQGKKDSFLNVIVISEEKTQ